VTTRKKIVGILLVLLSGGWLFVIPFIPLTSNKTVNFHFPVEEGAIKSAGVKPNQVIKSYPKFILDDLPHTFNRTLLKTLCNIVLVFFGYPGCSTVCPVTLRTLAHVYTHYWKIYQDEALKVVFVNLELGMTAEITMRYAKHFHLNFLIYQLSKRQLN